jgi:hypothetical protein
VSAEDFQRIVSAMLDQFFVGGFASLANIVIHALTTILVVSFAQAVNNKLKSASHVVLTGAMSATAAILMVAHVCEVMVWALTYWLVDVAPPETSRVYFAFVNYTTLGYGDVIPNKTWQLLGPMTAMNGVLLFGWSTAVIFEVLRKMLAGAAANKRSGG